MTFAGLLTWCGALVAVEALTELISSSKIMFGVRDWFSRPAPEPEPCTHPIPTSSDWDPNCCKKNCFIRFGWWLRGFIGELLNCGYCTSVWVAAAAAFVVPGKILWWLPTILIKWLVLHRFSNLLHETFQKWFRNAPFSFVFTHIHNNGVNDNGSKKD